MRIVFYASGAFAGPTLRWLAQSEHTVALVVTQPPRPSGRGQRITRTPTGVLAEELALPLSNIQDVNAGAVIEEIAALHADVAIAIAFGQKLGPKLLSAAPGGCLNLHASLLPKYRGAAPIHWAMTRGESHTGCTVFRMVDRMDAGPVLAMSETPIEAKETVSELHDRLAQLGVETVRAALNMFRPGVVPDGTAQDETQATPAPKLSKEDGEVDFDRPAKLVACHINGMSPWPGATTRYESKDGRWERITLMRARTAPDATGEILEPGTLDSRRFVATGDGFVELLEVKPSSGRLMSWKDFMNGRRVAPGDSLGTS